MELNVQLDHVHLLVMVPRKVSVSTFVGTVKGRTATWVFNSLGNSSAARSGVIGFGLVDIALIRSVWTSRKCARTCSTRRNENAKPGSEVESSN